MQHYVVVCEYYTKAYRDSQAMFRETPFPKPDEEGIAPLVDASHMSYTSHTSYETDRWAVCEGFMDSGSQPGMTSGVR